MSWHANLRLSYTRDGEHTVAMDRHHGPLRVLQRLYPEGPGICHHILVHPPGGVVGGDVLTVDASLGPNSHAVLTTPGATRFYRTAGLAGEQRVHATLDAGARLEWLPLETIAYNACKGSSSLAFDLAVGAEMMGWDVLALGLPAAGKAFESGSFRQQIQMPGVWLERGLIDAADQRLFKSPLGWAGHNVLATMWFAAGSALGPERSASLQELARAQIAEPPLFSRLAGVTMPNSRVIVLRVLADRVEPAMQLLARVWKAWRGEAWQLGGVAPRVWST